MVSFSILLKFSFGLQEDIEAVNAAVHQLETGESLFSGRSSKSILKNRAYKSNIRYNRNRRYADPNALGITFLQFKIFYCFTDDGDDDINEQNIFKDVKRVRLDNSGSILYKHI